MPTTWTSRANNALVSPDSNHLLYGGNATAKNNMTNEASGVAGSDTFDLRLIDRAKTRRTARAAALPVSRSCSPASSTATSVLCVMHTFQEDDLRSNTNTAQWLDIQKAAATAEGRNSPLFKGELGMYRGVIPCTRIAT